MRELARGLSRAMRRCHASTSRGTVALASWDELGYPAGWVAESGQRTTVSS